MTCLVPQPWRGPAGRREAGHYGDFDADITTAVLEESRTVCTDVLARSQRQSPNADVRRVQISVQGGIDRRAEGPGRRMLSCPEPRSSPRPSALIRGRAARRGPWSLASFEI